MNNADNIALPGQGKRKNDARKGYRSWDVNIPYRHFFLTPEAIQTLYSVLSTSNRTHTCACDERGLRLNVLYSHLLLANDDLSNFK